MLLSWSQERSMNPMTGPTVNVIFLTPTLPVAGHEYETTRPVEVDVDGNRYIGTFRVVAGSVIVYFESEIKFARHGMYRPEVVARWLLSDLSRRVEAKKRKTGGA
jgi:hypothetical protein